MRRQIKIFIVLVFLGLIILAFSIKPQKHLFVCFLDVGQGDAELVHLPSGQNILIDGGADNKLLPAINNCLPWWHRTIDYIFISHYHDDHYAGLLDLLDKYRVQNIITTSEKPNTALYQAWLEQLAEHGLVEQTAMTNQKYDFGQNIILSVLKANDVDSKNINDDSLVLKLSDKNIDFLFMGDLPAEQEQVLLKNNINLEAEVLKVGHHGSKYSSSEDFLAIVKAQLCVIAVGQDNSYGHPHQEAIDRLNKFACQVIETKDFGTIRVFSDGYKWWVK